MKKSLILMTAIIASLALMGVAFAGALPPVPGIGCPVQVKCIKIPPPQEKWEGKWSHPKLVKPEGPSCVMVGCKPCIKPGDYFAKVPRLANKTKAYTTEVFQLLCAKKDGGVIQCNPCGPKIKWKFGYKCMQTCGEVTTTVTLPPAYAVFDGKLPMAPSKVDCKTVTEAIPCAF